MNPAVASMLGRYTRRSVADHVHAMREVFQEIALLGLYRARFFDRAAFYGGTALRILHGLDRFSEDLDFTLLGSDPSFDLARFATGIEREFAAFGFDVRMERKAKSARTAIESAFLKADTAAQLLLIDAGEAIAGAVPHGTLLKIKMEVDLEPPRDFATETKFLLLPIPFSVRIGDLPSLFAGKMHALLCRDWKGRVKGRDWYDFAWFTAREVPVRIDHLAARLRQSGHLAADAPFRDETLRQRLAARIESLDVDRARADVVRFIADPAAADVWSREFFHAVAARIRTA